MVSGGIGYKHHSYRVQADWSYREADMDTVEWNGAVRDATAEINVLTAMLNGFYDFDIGGDITPFLGGGLGIAYVDLNTIYNIFYEDKSFAWTGMAGASYALTDHLDIVAFYRYLGMTDMDLDLDEPSLSFDGAWAHEVNLGVRYRF